MLKKKNNNKIQQHNNSKFSRILESDWLRTNLGMLGHIYGVVVFFNWDSLHARLNSHYKTWSYKKKKHKNVKVYRKSD